MQLKQTITFLIIYSLLILLTACSNTAKDPKDASEKLLAGDGWKIEQILVNDAVNFKDGKMIQQFGGIDFERYMETVKFKSNGDFEGYFKGDTKPMLLRWKLNANDITLTAADQKGGAWTIVPDDVTYESFTMSTKSTAYDYPRMTKIELRFRKSN
ncbi:hypothetical protein [Dyadobacter psychrotolerans]|uniref:Lipocalin-like domain-containing protein n=1 Tax=Dyadobacter psychrotolerans TaxID=2541721 RepID=A0A4R5DBH7_9BACT|nr:hypothetical protein [Dyadobacter psychrotolerans]TDE10247.1 hypothetical protein E0F88_28550 [Dyadobacter psychrotolerans]